MNNSRAFAIADDHSEILGHVSRWGILPHTVVHVDMHHDLGSGRPTDPVNCGNFLPVLFERGVHALYWIVPAPRTFLAKSAGVFLQTLPAECLRGLRDDLPGRFSTRVGNVQLHVRGADDLPVAQTCDAPLLVSYDLDFHYHRSLGGPTTDPIYWLNSLTAWLGNFDAVSVFVACSLRDGYVPPTYLPAAYWLKQWLRTGEVPLWSQELWRDVALAERCRTSNGGLNPNAIGPCALQPEPVGEFWDAWKQYVAGDYGRAVQLLQALPASFHFHPLDELKVELAHELVPPAFIANRVAAALPHFGTAPR